MCPVALRLTHDPFFADDSMSEALSWRVQRDPSRTLGRSCYQRTPMSFSRGSWLLQ